MIIHPTVQAGNVETCPHLPPSSPILSYNLDSAHLLCQTVHQAPIISHVAHCRKLLSVCWPPSLLHKAAILLHVQHVQWPTVVWKISGNILLGVLLLQTSPASSWASFLSFAHWALRFLISCLLPHLGQAPSPLRAFGYALPCAKDILTSTFHVVRSLCIEAGFNITSSTLHYFMYENSPEKRTRKTLER